MTKLKDRGRRVRAAATLVGLAGTLMVLAMVPAGASAAKPVAMPWTSEGTPDPPPVFPLVRPRVIENPPAPPTTGLRWRGWGSPVAIGRGVNDGETMRVRLSRIRWCPALKRRAYTRVRGVRAGQVLWSGNPRQLCRVGKGAPQPDWAHPSQG